MRELAHAVALEQGRLSAIRRGDLVVVPARVLNNALVCWVRRWSVTFVRPPFGARLYAPCTVWPVAIWLMLVIGSARRVKVDGAAWTAAATSRAEMMANFMMLVYVDAKG